MLILFLPSERWHRFLRHFEKTLTFDEILGSVFTCRNIPAPKLNFIKYYTPTGTYPPLSRSLF